MVKNKCPEHLKEIVDLKIMSHNGTGYPVEPTKTNIPSLNFPNFLKNIKDFG